MTDKQTNKIYVLRKEIGNYDDYIVTILYVGTDIKELYKQIESYNIEYGKFFLSAWIDGKGVSEYSKGHDDKWGRESGESLIELDFNIPLDVMSFILENVTDFNNKRGVYKTLCNEMQNIANGIGTFSKSFETDISLLNRISEFSKGALEIAKLITEEEKKKTR